MENKGCSLCGSREYSLLFEAKNKNRPQKAFSLGRLHPNHGRILKCKSCGLAYVSPRPNAHDLAQSYARLTDVGYSSQKESRTKTFRRKIRLIEKYAPKEKGRLLDIGCANGYFLDVAQKNGWQIDGVELSQELAKQAEVLLNIKIYTLTLENINFPPDFFDVVSMFDVFEHLPEPRETLSEIQRIMKPGGILAINFPAIDSFFAKIMGSHWCLLLEDHLNYFSKKTLTKMLDKYGFKVLFFKRHWQDLTLKYLVEISCSFSPKLSKTLAAIVKFLHLGKISLRYYIGQATVLAKKV